MLGFAQFILFIVGFVELCKGHWFTSYNGLQSIASWLLFLGTMGLMGISFTIRSLGRARSCRWTFYCSLLFLMQFTWHSFFGFLITLFAITIILLVHDKNFSRDKNWHNDFD